ncbi:Trafficking protein particle complex subunit 13 [Nymphon striatum]|nr:Trafficking protein particle complex subunit 13 [Nymphon striatum]
MFYLNSKWRYKIFTIHILVILLMRLTRPSLYTNIPVTCETQDLPGTIWDDELRKEIGCPPAIRHFGVGNLLLLPQSFGNIYLGEVFSSYISVHNDSNRVIKGVRVKADLQTGTQRVCLIGQDESKDCELGPGQSVDDVIHHEVKDIGTYILVCFVYYINDAGQSTHLKKFYKFQVMKPIDVKTKFYNAESNEVYLETQIQNITSAPINLENVSLDPSPLFQVNQLNDNVETKKSVFGDVNCLNPDDSRQYLFCMTPKSDLINNPKHLKGSFNIGKLDIMWRSNMGERGRLQTSQLQRMAPGYGDIRLTIEKMPEVAHLAKPFTITCQISNLCERAMDLMLILDNTQNPNLVWTGISGKQLGKLEPHASSLIDLELLPIEAGLQMISGIKLKDLFLRRIYDHDEIAQVFVTASFD